MRRRLSWVVLRKLLSALWLAALSNPDFRETIALKLLSQAQPFQLSQHSLNGSGFVNFLGDFALAFAVGISFMRRTVPL